MKFEKKNSKHKKHKISTIFRKKSFKFSIKKLKKRGQEWKELKYYNSLKKKNLIYRLRRKEIKNEVEIKRNRNRTSKNITILCSKFFIIQKLFWKNLKVARFKRK